MTAIVSLVQKIIDLILSERGHAVDADTVATVSQHPDLAEQLSQIIKDVESRITITPTPVEKNGNATPEVSASSIADLAENLNSSEPATDEAVPEQTDRVPQGQPVTQDEPVPERWHTVCAEIVATVSQHQVLTEQVSQKSKDMDSLVTFTPASVEKNDNTTPKVGASFSADPAGNLNSSEPATDEAVPEQTIRVPQDKSMPQDESIYLPLIVTPLPPNAGSSEFDSNAEETITYKNAASCLSSSDMTQTSIPSYSSLSETGHQPVLRELMPSKSFDQLTKTEETRLDSEQLQPGQVPTVQLQNQNTPKPAIPPIASITIPNARAGEQFSSPITASLEDGQQAIIIDVDFPCDIGLCYDKEQQSITGIPTESGSFDITVLWSCASNDNCKTKIIFVVNPDSRSLWKIVEPPAEAPYYKDHIDHRGIVKNGVKIVAASRRGRSHEHVGSFRDDDFYINYCDESEWNIMLVADGAGSAANSREGSRIATKTAGDYLYGQLNGKKGVELKKHILNWGPEDQIATKNAILYRFKQAATLAVNSIHNEAIYADQPVKSYSTTLLATVSLRVGEELFAASFWLGDGAIAAYSPSGKVRVLGNPDSGEYAGQTRFLDQNIIADPAFTGRISIGKWNDVSHLILMTDGVSDPRFETDNGLRNDAKWTSLVNELSPILVEANHAPERLAEWLNFFSTGNHDDRTIVVSW